MIIKIVNLNGYKKHYTINDIIEIFQQYNIPFKLIYKNKVHIDSNLNTKATIFYDSNEKEN